MGEEQNLEPEHTDPVAGSDDAPASEGSAEAAAPAVPAVAKGMSPGQRLAAKKAAKAVKKKEFKEELKEKAAEEQRKAEESQELVAEIPEAALPEEVQVVARGFSDFVHEQRSKIVGGIAAFVLISAGVILVRHLLDSSAGEAASSLQLALETAGARIDPDNKDGKTETGAPVFASRADRTKKSADAFASVSKNFADRGVAPWAKLAEASAQMELGKTTEAQKLYEGALAQAGSMVELKARAIEGIGIALEAQDKLDDATKRFEELKGLNGDASRDLAEYHIARIQLKKGEKDAAKDLLKGLYDRLSARPEDAPPSRFLKGEVEVRLAELDSSLVDKGTTGTGTESFTPEQLQQLLEQLKNKGGMPGAPGAE